MALSISALSSGKSRTSAISVPSSCERRIFSSTLGELLDAVLDCCAALRVCLCPLSSAETKGEYMLSKTREGASSTSLFLRRKSRWAPPAMARQCDQAR